MAKGNKGKSEGANQKSNRGQDENLHSFRLTDGTVVVRTQRWFRDEGRAAGAVRVEDDGTEAPAEDVTE